jgi:dipeptidase E
VRTIFAMGGGGFTTEPDNPALDEHILGLASKRVPKVCFLPTASGDAEEQLRRFYATYGDRPCEPTHLSLFRLGREPVDIAELLLGQDVVYVGGGSMRNMLAIWREHGLDRILSEAGHRGVVLAGLSAGAMCWFSGGVTTSSGRPEPTRGLGLLPCSMTVHLDGEPERKPVFLNAVREGVLPPGFAADDGVGLLFRDRRFVRAVSSRPEARALRVERNGTTELRVERVGAASAPAEERSAPFEVLELRRLRYGGGLRD